MTAFVYILTNKNNSVLYIGVTSDLSRRYFEHQMKKEGGFSGRYNLSKLIYAEEIPSITEAIKREKAIKKWNRAWKIKMIEEANPEWKELLPY